MCTPCPSRSRSGSAATFCDCVDGFVRKRPGDIHQGCLIRMNSQPTPVGNQRAFIMMITLQIETNSTDVQKLSAFLRTEISVFYDCPQDKIKLDMGPSRRKQYQAYLVLELLDDPMQVKSQLAETQGLLEEFLGLDARWIFKVLSLDLTCGIGYSPVPGSNASNISMPGVCMACSVGFYKKNLDNSPCLACPSGSSTSSKGSTNISYCACNMGYRSTNASELACVSRQYVSVKEAEDAARTVSTAVGTVVATNVALAVATAVASSVSTAVAASSGGAVGGAVGAGMSGGGGTVLEGAGSSGGGSGTLTLITQVQFLNQVCLYTAVDCGSRCTSVFIHMLSRSRWEESAGLRDQKA